MIRNRQKLYRVFKDDQIYGKRRKSRTQKCQQSAILNRRIKIVCTEIVTFKKRLEGGEGISQVDMLQGSTEGRGAVSTKF